MSVGPYFPLHQWDQLIDQAVITLNLLRPARINPALSAYAYLFCMFNYSATPLAPPGIKCQIHEKPNQRQSWGSHSIDGRYLGPALEHYRCFKVYATKTAHHGYYQFHTNQTSHAPNYSHRTSNNSCTRSHQSPTKSKTCLPFLRLRQGANDSTSKTSRHLPS